MLKHIFDRRLALALALAALVAAPPARGADDQDKAGGRDGNTPAPVKVTTSNDLVYSKVGDTELKLDLARPADGEGDGPFPAVVVIHGGGWQGGNKESNRRALTEFARRGYVAISPQYRLAPKDAFPAQVVDVKAAVRWLRSNAKEYKADADHVGAVGFSAGGHLSLMLGLTGPQDGFEGDATDAPSSRVQAVVNYFGPTDLAADDFGDTSRSIIKAFLGGTPADKPDAAAKASPLSFVSADDPPVLTFQGTKDPLVPHSQAIKLTEALSKAGVSGRLELIIGAGHGWQGDDQARTIDETYAFFDKYLKPAGARHP